MYLDTALQRLAVECYLYGYPLLLMDLSRQILTNVPEPGEERAPVNQFAHARSFPDHTSADVLTPNADTLSSSAWLDLEAEPVILSIPRTHDRFWMMPMSSPWTDVFAAPGSRTSGWRGGHFAVTGPGWSGELPARVQRIPAPTSQVRIEGHTGVAGVEDYPAVHALQDQYRLTPLSAWTGDPGTFTPPRGLPVISTLDQRTAATRQVDDLDADAFFDRLNQLLANCPPRPEDARAMEEFAILGVTGEGGRRLGSLAPDVARAAGTAPEAARRTLRQVAELARNARRAGWITARRRGDHGTDYYRRALHARAGLGPSLDADAICPQAVVDAEGQSLSGAHRYVLRFDSGQLPPVEGFWSLSMYDKGERFIENPLGRYTIGDRDRLRTHDDGSLDIYVQPDPPCTDHKMNWLPSPRGSFTVFLRLYWPHQRVLDGAWAPPPLVRIS